MAEQCYDKRSATGASWVEKPFQSRAAAGLVDQTDMPQALANVLACRDITKDDIDIWLEPKIRDLMPDPSTLTDMDKAVQRLSYSVINKEKIGVFGDYDVDGACSAALLSRVLRGVGVEVSVHIPDRFNEGYGPNLPALVKLKDEGCGLIITVDCGITATAPIAAAMELGVDVVIIDHHMPGPSLPEAKAVVNPNRLEDDGSLGHLAAAGVTFLVMVALMRHLRGLDFFDGGGDSEAPDMVSASDMVSAPDLMEELDIVALATVADVVPLRGLNRAFVRYGLGVMRQRRRPGLAMLADVARLEAAPDVQSLGFILGPRINAGGRIGNSSLGTELLLTSDTARATEIAHKLEELNKERRAIDHDVTQEAMFSLEDNTEQSFIMATGEGWNEGVIGIAASRLKDRFNRPSAVVSFVKDADGELVGKGSARSVAPFKLGEAILAAVQHGLLISGGGHDMAAGFALAPDKREAFEAFMCARADGAFNNKEPMQKYNIDSKLSAGHCTLELLDWLERVGPWGAGFPAPYFALEDVRLEGVRSIGKEKTHRAFRLSDATGRVDGVAFRVSGTPLGAAIDNASDGRLITGLGRVSRNRWQGLDKVQFILADLIEVRK